MDQIDPLSNAFREAFRCHPAGVAVITALGEAGPVALTVSSLISVSAAPPVVAFSLSGRSSAAPVLRQAETMVIHLLRAQDIALARLGATSGVDRFSGAVPFTHLPSGEPRYEGVGTWFRARRRGELLVEGNALIAAELIEGAATPGSDEAALIYLDRRWHRLLEEIEAAN